METTKLDKPNDGIDCVVNTCQYYMKGDHCSASKIQVGPRNASDSNETDCSTFAPNDRMS